MQTSFRKPLIISDMQWLESFESKTDAKTFADSLRKEKKHEAVRMQKVTLYGNKIFYRVYVGDYSYY